MNKRLISTILALSMTLSFVPTPAFALQAAPAAPDSAASLQQLAQENASSITTIYIDYDGTPSTGWGQKGWRYTDGTLYLDSGTFEIASYDYYGSVQFPLVIGKNATLSRCTLGSPYGGGMVTNHGTIDGATLYGPVLSDGTISDGGFYSNVTLTGGTVLDGTFKQSVAVGSRTEAADAVQIYGGDFQELDFVSTADTTTVRGGSFQNVTVSGTVKADITGGAFLGSALPSALAGSLHGGCFVQKPSAAACTEIRLENAKTYLPVNTDDTGAVTSWTTDSVSSLYAVTGTNVALKPTSKIARAVAGTADVVLTEENGTISFLLPDSTVTLRGQVVQELAIDTDGYPVGSEGGTFGVTGNGWYFDTQYIHPEYRSQTATLVIEDGTTIDFDRIANSDKVQFGIVNNGTITGTVNSTKFVANYDTIRDADLTSALSLYNCGTIRDSKLTFNYVGNGFNSTDALIENSALDLTGWMFANSKGGVLDGCYNSDTYVLGHQPRISNSGIVRNSKASLKLPINNGKNGTVDGGECSTVFNEGTITDDPVIHTLVATDPAKLNGAAAYYTFVYTALPDRQYHKGITAVNGLTGGIYDADAQTLYIATDLDTIRISTEDPIRSVDGRAFFNFEPDTNLSESYASTIDLSGYTAPATILLDATLPVSSIIDTDGYPVGSAGGTKDASGTGWNYRASQNLLVLTGENMDLGTVAIKCSVDNAGSVINSVFYTSADDVSFYNEGTLTNCSVRRSSVFYRLACTYNYEGGEIVGGRYEALYDVNFAGSITGADISYLVTDLYKPAGAYTFVGENGMKILKVQDLVLDTVSQTGNIYLLTDLNNIRVTTSDMVYYLNGEPFSGCTNNVSALWMSDYPAGSTFRFSGTPSTLVKHAITVEVSADTPDLTADVVTLSADEAVKGGLITLQFATTRLSDTQRFVQWTVRTADGTVDVTNAADPANASFTMPDAPVTVSYTVESKPKPVEPATHKLTVVGADIALEDGSTVADLTAVLTGTQLVATAYPDSVTAVFQHWDVEGLTLTADELRSRELHFTMPDNDVNLTAYAPAPGVDPTEPTDPADPGVTFAAVAGVAAWTVGGAVAIYEIGTIAYLAKALPEGAGIPANRQQLAVLLWQAAGKPEPQITTAYTDLADPEASKAARWAVETGLMTETGTDTFAPNRFVSKLQVIRSWNALQKRRT